MSLLMTVPFYLRLVGEARFGVPILCGKRVGVSSHSHKAINNLLYALPSSCDVLGEGNSLAPSRRRSLS